MSRVVVDHQGVSSSAPHKVGAQPGDTKDEGEEDEIVIDHAGVAAAVIVGAGICWNCCLSRKNVHRRGGCGCCGGRVEVDVVRERCGLP